MRIKVSIVKLFTATHCTVLLVPVSKPCGRENDKSGVFFSFPINLNLYLPFYRIAEYYRIMP